MSSTLLQNLASTQSIDVDDLMDSDGPFTVQSIESAISEAAQRFEDTSTPVAPSNAAKPKFKKMASSVDGDTLNDVDKDQARRNKLIDDNNLLKGIVMTPNGPQPSSRELIVRPSTLRPVIDNRATIDTTTVEAEFTQTLMESNYTSVSVKVSTPYVTGSAEYSESSSYKNTENEKTIFMSSRYMFPQGRIDFSIPGSGFANDVQLSPDFTNAITTALAKSTPPEKREALYNVFQEFGQVFRDKVQIGGVLSAHSMDTFSRSENESEVKQDIKVSLEGAVNGWGGGGSAAHGNTSSTLTTKQNRTVNVKYIVNGGDYTKIQDTGAWIATTNQSQHWRVIEVTSVVPVSEMLPEPTKTTVRNLLKPLLGKWVPVEKVPSTSQYPKAIYRPKDAIPAGWYWLGHSADASQALIVKPTFALKAGRNPVTTTGHESSGMTDQPITNLPQYQFLSTYFGGGSYNAPPGSLFAALRPDLFLQGRWELYGDAISTAVYVTKAVPPNDPADECFDLQSVVRVKLPSGSPPKPRWVLKKNVVWLDSGEY
ncbi:hypothetical protein VNI00_010406 [Paramarasmius palmivorus]|uniref:MACPF domain-containing protein n=1 Tax=Paramarasmius palmivorus TaxID=297713 RepID=A0AAW0BS51_9AGAR